MRNQTLFGMLSLALLASCGKGMQLVKSNQVQPPITALYSGKIVQPADATDGKLFPLSAFDLGELKMRMPFKNVDEKGVAASDDTVQIGDAPFKEGYVKNSNLVFRAIRMVLPPENVKKVNAFSLTLQGVKLFAAGDKLDVALKSQVLCLIDQGLCAGAVPGSDIKTANADFWKTAQTNPASLADAKSFKSSLTLDSDAVYEYIGIAAPATATSADTTDAGAKTITPDDSDPTDTSASVADLSTDKLAGDKLAAVTKTTTAQGVQLVIDLKQVFGLHDDKEIATWVFQHSTVYNKDGNFRKLRFALGNNLYATGGSFDYSVESTGQLPANNANAVGQPINGDSDINVPLSARAPVVIRNVPNADGSVAVKAMYNETVMSFEDDQDLKQNTVDSIKVLGDLLARNKDSVGALDIAVRMDAGTDEAANTEIAKVRANKLADEVKRIGIAIVPTVHSGVSKGSKGAVTQLTLTTAKGLAADKSTAVLKDLNDTLVSQLKGEIVAK